MDKFILIIGLGSMGKRRIRNLKSLGFFNIVGFDIRADRRLEANEKYFVTTVDSIEEGLRNYSFMAFIISVPPDFHHFYLKKAIDFEIPSFVEASVLDTNINDIILWSNSIKLFIAPSCTLYFHPAIKKIYEIIQKGELGRIANIVYHSGQFLPDWHTYESVSEFYVSKKETGGAREIVPFELTWITLLFGFPLRVTGFYKKTINIKGAEEIDDSYHLLLDYDSMIISLVVDVVSRYATRKLMINGDKKQLTWSWDEKFIKIYDPIIEKWTSVDCESISSEIGYNKNITEKMYIDEMDCFMSAVMKSTSYPNNLLHDLKVLKLLYKVEESSDSNTILFY